MHEPHHSILSLFSLASFATIITLTSAVGGSVGGADDSLLLVVSAAAANITTDNSTRKNDAPAPQLLTLLPPPLRANNISTSFDDNTSLSPPPPSPYSLSEANSTTQNNNNNSIVSYVCNAPAFGKELSVPSCTNALHHLGLGSVQLLWGMREEDPEGLQGPQGEQGKGESQGKRQSSDARTNNNFDVLLPQRSISDDGACVVEPGLGPGVESARASWEDVAQAALVVVRRCAGAEPSRGGLAKNIGGDNNLRVFVSKYDPAHIRCYGKMLTPGFQSACQQVLDRMRTGDERESFGPRGDDDVDVGVPFLMVSDDHACKFTIRSTSTAPSTTGHKARQFRTDAWSWGRFWEAGVALAGVCVRQGKEGVQGGLGERGYLYMEVGGPQG